LETGEAVDSGRSREWQRAFAAQALSAGTSTAHRL